MKKTFLLGICFVFICAAQAFAYAYSYVPHEKKAVVYQFLTRRSEQCAQGTRYAYPKKAGVCAACPDGGTFLYDAAAKKNVCLKCPANALLVKRFGYAMCVADKPFDSKKTAALTAEDRLKILEKTAAALSADYTVEDTLVAPQKSEKEKLTNVCEAAYPTEKSASRAVATCLKLKKTNDFLCPYVEKDAAEKWTCRACPKNAPYKNKDGGCFTCPFGEEIVSIVEGKAVCASEMPKTDKKAPAPARKAAVKKKSRKR